jgi:hypothetical protein
MILEAYSAGKIRKNMPSSLPFFASGNQPCVGKPNKLLYNLALISLFLRFIARIFSPKFIAFCVVLFHN